jgi:hypothetical protein
MRELWDTLCPFPFEFWVGDDVVDDVVDDIVNVPTVVDAAADGVAADSSERISSGLSPHNVANHCVSVVFEAASHPAVHPKTSSVSHIQLAPKVMQP